MDVHNEGPSDSDPVVDEWTTLWSTDTCRVEARCSSPGHCAGAPGATDKVALVGEIDLEHADAVAEVLCARVTAGPARLEIDLSRLEFIDSFGISRLIITQQVATEAGVQVALVRARPSTRRVLVVSGLLAFLNVQDEPSPESA